MSKRKHVAAKLEDSAVTIVDSVVSLFTHFPIVQSGAAIKKSYESIKEELFNEKLQVFFEAKGDLHTEDIETFLKMLDKNQEEFFKRLFIIIDRLEEKRKAEIIGKMFKALVERKISVDDFQELSLTIERIHLSNIDYLLAFYAEGNTTKYKIIDSIKYSKALSAANLVYEVTTSSNYTDDITGKELSTGVYTRYKISPLGSIILNVHHIKVNHWAGY